MDATTVYTVESYIRDVMMNDAAVTEMMNLSKAELNEMLEQLMPVFLGVLGVALLLGLITLIAMWKIFKKAGQAGWKVLIPVYSDYIMFKISWKVKYFWIAMLLMFLGEAVMYALPYIPEYYTWLMIAQWVFYIPALVIVLMLPFKLAKAFRKGFGFGLGMLLLPWIFCPILGFGKAKFRRRKRRKAVVPAAEA